MVSLTILELLYLVLILFITVIGTLLTVVLLRTLKILRVGTELADIYFKIKQVAANASAIPDMIREKILDMVGEYTQTHSEEEIQKEPK